MDPEGAQHLVELDVEKQLARQEPRECHLSSRDQNVVCHGDNDRRCSNKLLRDPGLASTSEYVQQGGLPNWWTLWCRVSDIITTYGCLFCVVIAANAVALVHVIGTLDIRSSSWMSNAGTPVAANFMVAVLARNEHFVNMLFRIACIRPTHAPFVIRAALSQIHQYGGLHSGCAASMLMWYCLETVLISISFANGQADAVCLAMTWVILVFLGTISLAALPFMRRMLHDSFEVVHRFAGWSVLTLIWIQVTCVASLRGDGLVSKMLLSSPATWFLGVATLLIIYPWLRVRNKPIQTTRLSDHALQIHFEGRAGPCTAVKLSDHPLRENHPFACIPQRDNHNAFSVIVSKAGDWTSNVIQSPPKSLWIRQTPQRGVLWVARMFSPVVIVATGSGIGPCLGLFNGDQELSCRVLWSTRQPVATYGQAIVTEVRQADPHAVIIDTDQYGRPDLPREAEKLYQEAGAEAVIVISNQELTRNIVTYLARRGICARGPIWDS